MPHPLAYALARKLVSIHAGLLRDLPAVLSDRKLLELLSVQPGFVTAWESLGIGYQLQLFDEAEGEVRAGAWGPCGNTLLNVVRAGGDLELSGLLCLALESKNAEVREKAAHALCDYRKQPSDVHLFSAPGPSTALATLCSQDNQLQYKLPRVLVWVMGDSSVTSLLALSKTYPWRDLLTALLAHGHG